MGVNEGRYLVNYYVCIENESPLHIAGNNGEILIDKSENKPYMPATGIVGALKAYLNNSQYCELCRTYFGSDEEESLISVYDAYGDKVKLESRPAVKIDYEKGCSENSSKFDRNFLGRGHEFNIRIKAFHNEKEKVKEIKELIEHCIIAIDKKHIQFGGLKSIGGGVFKVKDVKCSNFDLANPKELKNYLLRKEDKHTVNYKNIELKDNIVYFKLQGKTTGPLLIKGNSKNDCSKSDAENIKDYLGNYIIPGSSLKGVLRNNADKILSFVDKAELLEYMFGNNKNNSKFKSISRVFCEDTIIESSSKDNSTVYNRIKIDKFSGGTMEGSLFNEDCISGEFTINIKYILDENKEELNNSAVALIVLLLRDIAMGDLSLGGGFSIGRGRIRGSKLSFKYLDKDVVIDFDSPSKEVLSYLNSLVTNLQE